METGVKSEETDIDPEGQAEQKKDKEDPLVEIKQEERRQKIFDEQKNWQFDFAAHSYKVTHDDWSEVTDPRKWTEYPLPASTLSQPGSYYQYQLMCSEWLIEVPENFEEDWLMVPCPWGKKCLVVSGQGGSLCYDYEGNLLKDFPSALPGGNLKNPGNFDKDNVILDCIYHEIEKTFYVLDIMCWTDQQFYDNEAELRFFLLKSRFEEKDDVKTASKYNPYKFIPLESYPCSKDAMKTALEETSIQVDGCLFYHKKAQYTFGVSPMALWLKPFMMKEVLQVDVPDKLMEQKPVNYNTYQDYIKHIYHLETGRPWGSGEGKKGGRKGGQKGAGDAPPRKPRGPDRSKEFIVDLMMSEWLLNVPNNLENDWLAVVCPVGKRCLVIAIDGETKSYTKTGFRIPGYFVSLLPGGNMKYSKDSMTLLDCIFCAEKSTYFILDIICWDKTDLMNNPAEVRFQRIHDEMNKSPNLRSINPKWNHHKFAALKQFPCTKDGLQTAIMSTRFEIDGLLFFKKDVTYVSDTTPNVLWTKPYMLPEVLEVPVPNSLLIERPVGYITFEQFVEDTRNGITIEKKKKKKKKSQEFVPQVPLDLPPPATYYPGKGQEQKKKKKKPRPQTENDQDSDNTVARFGRQGQFLARGLGQRPITSGRGNGTGRGLDHYYGAQRGWSPHLEDQQFMMYNRNTNYDPYNMSEMLGAIDPGYSQNNNRQRKKYF